MPCLPGRICAQRRPWCRRHGGRRAAATQQPPDGGCAGRRAGLRRGGGPRRSVRRAVFVDGAGTAELASLPAWHGGAHSCCPRRARHGGCGRAAVCCRRLWRGAHGCAGSASVFNGWCVSASRCGQLHWLEVARHRPVWLVPWPTASQRLIAPSLLPRTLRRASSTLATAGALAWKLYLAAKQARHCGGLALQHAAALGEIERPAVAACPSEPGKCFPYFRSKTFLKPSCSATGRASAATEWCSSQAEWRQQACGCARGVAVARGKAQLPCCCLWCRGCQAAAPGSPSSSQNGGATAFSSSPSSSCGSSISIGHASSMYARCSSHACRCTTSQYAAAAAGGAAPCGSSGRRGSSF